MKITQFFMTQKNIVKEYPKYCYYFDMNTKEHPGRVKVLYCVDGDTFVGIDSSNIKKNYRLSNVDTPEMNQPWGIHAKKFLAHVIEDKHIYVMPFGYDKYGREIVDAFLDFDRTISINDALLKEGLSKCHSYDKVNNFKTHGFFSLIKKNFMVFSAQLHNRGMFGSVEKFYSDRPFLHKTRTPNS